MTDNAEIYPQYEVDERHGVQVNAAKLRAAIDAIDVTKPPPTRGAKYDANKPDLSLIPEAAAIAEALGYMFGAAKYGRYNYRKGLEATRLIAAALRHIQRWFEGEELDPESGLSHLGHARCNLGMLLDLQARGKLIDDRYKEPTPLRGEGA